MVRVCVGGLDGGVEAESTVDEEDVVVDRLGHCASGRPNEGLWPAIGRRPWSSSPRTERCPWRAMCIGGPRGNPYMGLGGSDAPPTTLTFSCCFFACGGRTRGAKGASGDELVPSGPEWYGAGAEGAECVAGARCTSSKSR